MEQSPDASQSATEQDQKVAAWPYLLVFFVICAIIAAGTIHHSRGINEATRTAALTQLDTVADLQAQGIGNWLAERHADAEVIASNGLLADAVERWLAGASNTVSDAAMNDWLKSFLVRHDYQAVCLLDAAGTLRMAIPSEAGDLPTATRQLAQRVLQTGTVDWTDLVVGGERPAPHMDIVAPLVARRDHGSTRTVGAVVLCISPERFLYPMLLKWPVATRTGESVLARREGDHVVFLNRLRRRAGDPIGLRLPIEHSALPSAQFFRGIGKTVEGRDYHGVPVLAAIRPVPLTSWIIVCKQDIREVRAAEARYRMLVYLLVGVLVSGLGAGLGGLWLHQRALLFRQRLREVQLRAQAEALLAESRQMFADVLNAIPQRVFWKDRDSRYLGCNMPFARDAGLDDPAQIIGKDDRDLGWFATADLYRADDRAIMESGQPLFGYEEPQSHPDGSLTWLRTSKMPLRDAAGRIIGILGTYEDITDRRRMEEERARLAAELERKNRELEQILYMASHDLRSPLVNVEGFSRELVRSIRALQEQLETVHLPQDRRSRLDELLGRDIPEALRFIRTSIGQMDRLLSGFLRVARLGRMPLEIGEVNMDEVASRALEGLEFVIKKLGVAVERSPLPPCRGDAGQLAQVMTNLLDNAIKYLDPDRPGKVALFGRCDGPECVYCVEDNGIGIDCDDQKRIFDLFCRLSPADRQGEGVGLAIVQIILSRLGGRVWVESVRGQGSKFFFALPAH